MKNIAIHFKKKCNQLLICLIVLITCLSCEQDQKESLFQENAKDWYSYGDAKWNFHESELISTVHGNEGYLVTKKSYMDFILEMDFKPDSTINSGVFIRCKNAELNPENCYEVNIWDLHPDKDNSTGAIVTKQPPLVFVETIYKWNTLKIKADKNSIKVWINDQLTVDFKDKNLSEGFVGLQSKGTGEIRFRNCGIKILNAD